MISVNSFKYAPDSHNAKDWQKSIEDQLAVLDGICRKHGLKYSLAFGGLLGAIRHRGMIPWDNDADIVMFEDDYLKLRELSNSGQFPEGYELVDRSVEDDYSLLFGRFINKNTACPLGTSSFNGGANGVFIDVFILFPVPEEQERQVDCITDFLVWEEMQCHIKRRCKFRSELFRKRWREAKQMESEKGREETLRILEERFRSKQPATSSKCIHGSGGAYQGYPVLDAAWFENPVYKPFGSHEFAVPNGFLSFFRRFYGNNWRMFPSGERFHAYSCANLNIPGYQITQDYMQFIDSDKAVADFDLLKQLKMEEMLAQSVREPQMWGLRGQLAADQLNKEFAHSLSRYVRAITPERLASPSFDMSAMARIQQETDILLRYQLYGNMRTWRIALPFKPELLSAALWSCYVVRSDFWTVEKVIRAQRADSERCVYGSSELDRLLDRVLEATGNLYQAIDEHDTDAVAAALNVLDTVCPAIRHARVGHAFLLLSNALCDSSTVEASYATVSAWSNDLDDDDYLCLFAGELAVLAGDSEAAKACFSRLASESMNGMVLLDASDFCSEHNMEFKIRDLSRIPESVVKEGTRKVAFPKLSDSLKGRLIRHHANKDGVLSKEKAKLKSVRAEIDDVSQRTSHYQALRRLSSDRFFVWERTYPRKQAILDAAKAGNEKETRRLARPYLDGVYRLYDNDHMGLAIDQDILQACLPLFEQERGKDFVDEYLSLIPEPHRESMDAMMRRVGIDHPYLHDEWWTN